MAIGVMVVLFVEAVRADGASARVFKVSVLLVLLSLYRKLRLNADVIHILMIPAFGEILACADSADGARPSLSGTHFGLQRQCGARVRKRSAVRLCADKRPTDCRLGSMSARQAAGASRPAR